MKSLEQAAGRELSEEVPKLFTHEFSYIGSTKVNDFRYKGTKDGIMTSLFVTYKLGGTEIAGDDIEEVEWFDLSTFDLNILTEHHHPLFEMLKKHLKL
jgi:bifunctional NMN adenylyltransferase/nudix hydrolase